MVRMFSGSDDYEEHRDNRLIDHLQNELRYANSLTNDCWVVQKVSDRSVIAVFDWRIRLDEIVKKFPCGEFMHTHRTVQRSVENEQS